MCLKFISYKVPIMTWSLVRFNTRIWGIVNLHSCFYMLFYNYCFNKDISQVKINNVLLIFNIKATFLFASDTECDYGKWGEDCAELCQCSMSSSKSCNVTDGTCTCRDGWTGDTCAEDINECSYGRDTCNRSTETCTNTIGSFVCNCKDGYRRNADRLCQGWYSVLDTITILVQSKERHFTYDYQCCEYIIVLVLYFTVIASFSGKE